MSYCVNCGVELDESAKKCVLCGTKVYNPNEKKDDEKKLPPFPEETHIPQGIKPRFLAYIASMVFLIPNIVCLFANAIVRSSGFWALYVNATSFLIWVIFICPFFTKRLRPYLMWTFDTLAITFYVFFFFVMDVHVTWFYTCALPIILFNALLVLVFMIWVKRKKRHWVLKSIHVFVDIALSGLICGGILGVNGNIKYAVDIGIIIFASSIALVAFLIYCYSSKHIRSFLSKKFFV